MQAKDWSAIALHYNGRGQVSAYSAKMRQHYRRSKLPKEILPYKARPARQRPAPADGRGHKQLPRKRDPIKFILELVTSIFGRK